MNALPGSQTPPAAWTAGQTPTTRLKAGIDGAGSFTQPPDRYLGV